MSSLQLTTSLNRSRGLIPYLRSKHRISMFFCELILCKCLCEVASIFFLCEVASIFYRLVRKRSSWADFEPLLVECETNGAHVEDEHWTIETMNWMANKRYGRNEVVNSKCQWWSFLPLMLWAHWHDVAVVNPLTAWLPIIVIFAIAFIREGIDESHLHQQDMHVRFNLAFFRNFDIHMAQCLQAIVKFSNFEFCVSLKQRKVVYHLT